MPQRRRSSAIAIVRMTMLIAGLLALLVSAVRSQEGPTVVVLPTEGVVDPIMANYVREGIDRAVRDGAPAVVIELDTPGGSLDATADIVEAELNADLPVIVWVGPAGSRAASAGTFLTLASHVAAMAPATNIGAATPVTGQGEDIEGAIGRKVLNDTIADIKGIAEARGRPVDWAISTVEDALSFTVDEALLAGAIDIKAASIEDLLAQADGMVVDVNGEPWTLATAGVAIERVPMNPFQQFLHILSDPNIAFILLTLGFYGVFFELQNPNYVTGILGAFALILAFMGLGSLPLNVAGLLLIGLAVILFVLELTVTSGGLLTVGGLVAFALGASALYTEPGDPVAPSVQVDLPVIIAMTFLTALFVVGILYAAWKNRQLEPVNIGAGGLDQPLLDEGTEGTVRRQLSPEGTIYAAGEDWTARSASGGVLDRGTPVRVIGQDGMTLIVESMLAIGSGSGSASGPADPETPDPTPAERTI